MADVALDRESLARAHARTYHGFTLAVKWFAVHLATIMVFLLLTFATPAGWGWGLVAAIVVAGIGVWAMTHGLARSSETGSLEAG